MKKDKFKLIIVLIIIILLILPAFTYRVNAELTSKDFSELSYTDPKGDQYTLYHKYEDDSDTPSEKYGVKGKHSLTFDMDTSAVDIVSMSATLNSGIVTVIITFASDILYGMSMEYHVWFVENTHQQPDELLDPKNIGSTISLEYVGEQSIISIEFDNRDAYSYPRLSSLEGSAEGNTITFTVSASELEDAGLTPRSGFGLYAYSHMIGSKFGTDTVYFELTWDTAGVGAAKAPNDFNSDLYKKKSGEDEDRDHDPRVILAFLVCLVIIILIIVIIIFFVIRFTKKKRSTSQPPSYQHQPEQQYLQQYPCQVCGRPLIYNAQYQRWYCENCMRYV